LGDLLDHLLFEATIANRIREIGRFSGNLHRSVQAFVEFFRDLIDYQIAFLCLRRSTGPLVVVHLKETATASLLEAAKEMLRKNKLMSPKNMNTAKVRILNPESLSQSKTCGVEKTPGCSLFTFPPAPNTEVSQS
jgi:hypothetical protein